jgi:hypothetical protein
LELTSIIAYGYALEIMMGSSRSIVNPLLSLRFNKDRCGLVEVGWTRLE